MQKQPQNIVLILCLVAFAQPVHAQAMWALLFGKKIHNDNLSLGIHVEFDVSDLTNTAGSNLLAGIAVGTYTNIKLGAKWALSNYFIFKSSRGAASLPLACQLQSNIPGANSANIRLTLTYFEISPLARYNITPEVSIAAGLRFAFRAIANDKYSLTLPDVGKQTIIYNTKGYYNWLGVDAASQHTICIL